MSIYYVHVPKSARKVVNKAPLPWQVRILDTLRMLKSEPLLGIKMKGKYSGQRKIVIWPFRILYRIKEDIKLIEIMEIEHRGHTSYD